jgi:3-methyladenine DNA glycosylase AlkD
VLGVRADDLRKLAKATAKAHADWPDRAWLALLDQLYAGDIFEQRSLAGMLLGVLHPLRHRLELARLRTWLAGQQGWAEVDATCQSELDGQRSAGALGRMGAVPGRISARPDNVSLRRASLVLLVSPLRRSADPRLTARALANVQRLQHERDGMVAKAVSWVLRSMVAEQPATVRAYLAEPTRGRCKPSSCARCARSWKPGARTVSGARKGRQGFVPPFPQPRANYRMTLVSQYSVSGVRSASQRALTT